jgi:RNA polymerase sigma factor (sigma-70 family)
MEAGAAMAVANADADGGDAARVEAVLRKHRAQLLWIARRWSGSADDAEDALQRALEIYVRRLESLDPATELAWLKVVVRHEAMAIRRARVESLPLEGEDLADRLPAPGVAVDERAERNERLARSLQALARLKPDERTALLLKAQGLSYREISERLGWTYTKVNRAITEGRRRFLGVFANIESGEECERFAPVLLALVRGAVASEDVIALRPHLRHCASCRATVRELHASRRHRLALHLPFVASIAPTRWLGERLSDAPTPRPLLASVLQRLPGPDVAAGVQMASSGGGRGPAVAALLGLCLSGGAGSYCLATGVLPDPTRLVREADEPKKRNGKPQDKRVTDRRKTEPEPATAEVPGSIPSRPVVLKSTATAQPEPKPSKPLKRTKPTSRSDPEPEFGFESATGSPSSAEPDQPTASAATTSPPPASSGGSTPSSSPPPTSGGEFLP